MRKIFVLFILMFAFGAIYPAYSQIKVITESDLQFKKAYESNIEKGITNITTTRYDIEEGKITEESEKISKVIIDLSKNTYTEITYYPNYSKTVVSFNELKNVKDISIYYTDNSLMSRVITNYEADDITVINKVYYFGNSMTFKTNYIYSSGNIIRQDYVDSIGKINSYSKMFYDNSDKLIEEDKYNEKDSLEIVYQYVYDNSGNCIEENINYPQSNYTSKILIKYDNSGSVIEKSAFSLGNKMISKNEYKYDKNGLLVEDISNSIDGKVVSKSEYKYDGSGNKFEWKYTDFVEDIEYLYKYEYQ